MPTNIPFDPISDDDVPSARDEQRTDQQNSSPGSQSQRKIAAQDDDSGESKERPKKRSRMVVSDIEPDPPQRRKLLFDQAHRLATMPRGKIEEGTKSAFWAAIATAAGALGGYNDYFSANPLTKTLDIVELGVFLICVALAIHGALDGRHEQTSKEYLAELYGMPQKECGELKKRWRRWFG